MVKNIVKNIEFLSAKSIDCTIDDKNVIEDLKDTLKFNISRCVGMAANMIGYHKNAVIYSYNGKSEVLINPVVLKKSGEYKTTEGCLCHIGEKEVIRYKKIKIQYLDENFKIKIKTYEDYIAEIIQHELDHLEGIIV